MNTRLLKQSVYTCLRPLFLLLFFCLPVTLIAAEKPPKLILIHLDSVSSQALTEEIKKGNMPNIERIFYEHGLIERAITYYPSKTPFVISSIRDATPSTISPVVGWEIADFNDEVSLDVPETFALMTLSKMRLARINLLYGLPLFNRLADIALMNTLDYFEDYRVLEFYWYEIDTYGHFQGEYDYRDRLRDFDKRIGRYIDRLDDDVNVIIYADHGMVFGEPVPIKDDLKEHFGDRLRTFSYPSVYITDPDERELFAREIVDYTELDFAFFMLDSNTVKGFSDEATLYFNSKDDLFQYQYTGHDPLKYFENGYNGEFLSADEWLRFSIDLDFPATPVQVYWFLQNENSGEIVTSFKDGKFARSSYTRNGNHGGLNRVEVVVPVLVKGPNVEYIGEFEVLWLQELFNEIQDFEFRQTPRRDLHYVSSRYNTGNNNTRIEAAFSPTYRLRFAAEIAMENFDTADLGRVWTQYDLYRSYISRLWFGVGVDFYGPDTVGMYLLKHELHVRNFSARTLLSTAGHQRFTLGYSLNRNVTLELTNFTGFGIRLSM